MEVDEQSSPDPKRLLPERLGPVLWSLRVIDTQEKDQSVVPSISRQLPVQQIQALATAVQQPPAPMGP